MGMCMRLACNVRMIKAAAVRLERNYFNMVCIP